MNKMDISSSVLSSIAVFRSHNPLFWSLITLQGSLLLSKFEFSIKADLRDLSFS